MVTQKNLPACPTWLNVDVSALRHNAATLKACLSSGTRLGVVVKANAYGHGLELAAPALLAGGADWLIVNHASEAVAMRQVQALSDVPLYVCGPMFAFEADALVKAKARVMVTSIAQVEALAEASRRHGGMTPLHLKIETGTHRQGLDTEDALRLAQHVRQTAGVVLEGLATHFADIEDTTDHGFAEQQRTTLWRAREAFAQAGFGDLLVHCANSAATLIDGTTHGDLVRAGIATYGLWPSKETHAAYLERHHDRLTLKPALSWCARISEVKDVPAGGYIGYGRTYRATRDLRIGIVPVGYADGYDRGLSNVAHMLVNGSRAPVRGRVCMNMTMIDVTDVPSVQAGDACTLLGPDGDERISAEQLAAWMGTIHYEAVARLSPQLPRLPIEH